MHPLDAASMLADGPVMPEFTGPLADEFTEALQVLIDDVRARYGNQPMTRGPAPEDPPAAAPDPAGPLAPMFSDVVITTGIGPTDPPPFAPELADAPMVTGESGAPAPLVVDQPVHESTLPAELEQQGSPDQP